MQAVASSGAFNAAIFRRGNKVEAFGGGPEEETVDEAEELKTKLNSLYDAWAAIRTGRDLIGAIWRPDKQAAEVTTIKGKLLGHMGFMQGSKLYLHAEEALYLIDRANLLLFLDFGKSGNRLLSIQEAQELMISSGVSMDHYLCYCKLVRAGYIVQRNPARWIIKPTDDPTEIWKLWIPEDTALPLQSVSNANGKGSNGTDAQQQQQQQQQPGSVPRNLTNTSEEYSSGWWSSLSSWVGATVDVSQLPTIEVEPGEYPNTFSLPRMQKVATGPQLLQKKRHADFDVYPASSQFSRRLAPDPMYILSIGTESFPGSLPGLTAGEALAYEVPLRHVAVEKGDIGMYGLEHVKLRNVLH